MSFILDALKKSESERARQAGPALMEVRIAPPRNRLPLWAVLVGVLLLVNILVLGAVLVFRERPAPAPATAGAAATPAPSVAQAPVPAAAAPLASAPAVAPGPASASSAMPLPAPPLPDAASGPALNPADYVPALPAGSLAAAPGNPAQASSAAEDAGLPTRDDLVAANQQVPEVRLSLHVFDFLPANRYVLINSTRLREGDSMADGMRLERITESGVVMSWRGNRFRLRQGD